MALGTAAVLAGMVGVVLVPAVVALGQMTTHDFGATGAYVSKGSTVARQHPAAELRQVVVAVCGNDIGHLDHGCRSPIIPSRLP